MNSHLNKKQKNNKIIVISGLLQFAVKKKTLGKVKVRDQSKKDQKKEENEEKPRTNTVVEIKKFFL